MVSNAIQSLRDIAGQSYIKPDKSKVDGYEKSLGYSTPALDYLKSRGITDETALHFRLGYCESRKAITIPIYKDGELINIKYRFLNPNGAKYMGETGAENWVYNEDGFDHAEKLGGVLIVEGEFDLMSVWQTGVRNVVSPSSGKDSYGVWIERLDKIPRIYIAYDNDEAGKGASKQIADRIGVEKCFEVKYKDAKDANEFLLENTGEDLKQLLKEASPYYSYQFKGLNDVISSLRNKTDDEIKIDLIPKVAIEKDWMLMVGGRTNAGKTSYILNVASEIAKQGIPTLILPFERGIQSVGKRYLQISFDKTIEDFSFMNDEEWAELSKKCLDDPVYFAMPKKNDVRETIIKSRRLFDTRVVIVDHLDYLVRGTSGNKENDIGSTLQDLKRVAEEYGIILIIVTHVRKIDNQGAETQKKAGIEDLKGSSSVYQDPECVVMLHNDGHLLDVDVVKNKGEMASKLFEFNTGTGKLTAYDDDF